MFKLATVGRIFVVVCVSWGAQTIADEGFSEATTPVPTSIHAAWDATVRVQASTKKGSSVGAIKTQGTGVVISYDSNSRSAIIVTNGHVAGCPTSNKCGYTVTFHSETKNEKSFSKIELVGEFPKYDLAFLKVTLENFVPQVAKLLENSLNLPETSKVAAIGFPRLPARKKKAWLGEIPSDASKSLKRFSVGDVLNTRPLHNTNYPYAFETDTTIDLPYVLLHNADTLEGNSGGPLVETHSGQVVGVNTGIINAPTSFQHCQSSLNPETNGCTYYSVPSDLILEKLNEL